MWEVHQGEVSEEILFVNVFRNLEYFYSNNWAKVNQKKLIWLTNKKCCWILWQKFKSSYFKPGFWGSNNPYFADLFNFLSFFDKKNLRPPSQKVFIPHPKKFQTTSEFFWLRSCLKTQPNLKTFQIHQTQFHVHPGLI